MMSGLCKVWVWLIRLDSTMSRILLEPGFILHQRAFRDTSMILDCFTRGYGRKSLIAKGIRARTRRTSWKTVVQPFRSLLLSWSEKSQSDSQLGLMTAAEDRPPRIQLPPALLQCGFYMNELLLYFTTQNDEQPLLFALYEETLTALTHVDQAAQADYLHEFILRRFEYGLLQELGYGLQLTIEQPQAYYYYDIERGLQPLITARPLNHQPVLSAQTVTALQAETFDQADRMELKRLMRYIIDYHLQGRPLRSRELFRSL